MPELWSVSGNQIVMNETEKEALINSQSVYISNPDKIKLVKKLQSWVDLTNQLNETLLGDFLRPNPVTTEFCRGRFIITDKYIKTDFGNSYTYEINMDPDFLKSLVQG